MPILRTVRHPRNVRRRNKASQNSLAQQHSRNAGGPMKSISFGIGAGSRANHLSAERFTETLSATRREEKAVAVSCIVDGPSRSVVCVKLGRVGRKEATSEWRAERSRPDTADRQCEQKKKKNIPLVSHVSKHTHTRNCVGAGTGRARSLKRAVWQQGRLFSLGPVREDDLLARPPPLMGCGSDRPDHCVVGANGGPHTHTVRC